MRIIHDLKPDNGPFYTVEEAEYVDGYRLRLFFNDGTSHVVDFHDYLRDAPRPWITTYWDLDEFKNFRLFDGRLMWGDFDLIFPISDLYSGTITYDFQRRPEIPESFRQPKASDQIPVLTPTLRRLKARAKKEEVPLELLVDRYLEEGLGREGKRSVRV
jgi:hypothetical protein